MALENSVTVEAPLPPDGLRLLDGARAMILDGRDPADAIGPLVDELRRLKQLIGDERWRVFCASTAADHPLRAMIHESPLSRRAFDKPRGYAGDAETLDLAYGVGAPPAGTTELGARIFTGELRAQAVRGVRERRDILAAMVDDTAARAPRARVLSVACGHLREAQISRAVADGALGTYFALDQDPSSLARVVREQRDARITAVLGSVRTILARQTRFTDLDLVYSAGLYDYLPTEVARQLTAALFAMLRPGGRLAVANCAPNWDSAAYMEAFMAWTLLYRADAEVAAFASSIPDEEIDHLRLHRNPARNVVFLEVVKRSDGL
jgi:hypothetical protein